MDIHTLLYSTWISVVLLFSPFFIFLLTLANFKPPRGLPQSPNWSTFRKCLGSPIHSRITILTQRPNYATPLLINVKLLSVAFKALYSLT